MPWRGPAEKGEFPTLGYLVGDWIEANCVIPDGFDQGKPFVLTDEMWLFLLHYYRLKPTAVYDPRRPSAPFHYRGGQLIRPQKWGKGPFAAALCLAEAFGPVRFGGWDEFGEPIGVPVPTPWIQIVANSEEQADNTWLALLEMASRGPVAEIPGIELGVTDINLPGGGKIEPRTAAGKARLGARITFAIFDETGLMTVSSGGVLLVTTMKRNISGMQGRWLETTNAYDPSEQSVAQLTHEAKAPDVYTDYRPSPRTPDLDDDADALACLVFVYGDSWWVDHERILADARDPSVCPSLADALRFFFNLIVVGVSDAVDAVRWAAKARPRDLKPRDRIALGFDGSRSSDCTSLVASRLHDGRWFHLRTWIPAECPAGRVPRGEIDQALRDAFRAYRVSYLFLDPYKWQEYAEIWASRWPDRVVEVPTANPTRMDRLVTRFQTAFAEALTHDGDETLTRHALNAALTKGQKRQPRPEENPSIPRYHMRITKKREAGHIDALIAALLAEDARGQAIEEGALARPGPVAGRMPAPDGLPAGGNPWRPSGANPWRGSGRLQI